MRVASVSIAGERRALAREAEAAGLLELTVEMIGLHYQCSNTIGRRMTPFPVSKTPFVHPVTLFPPFLMPLLLATLHFYMHRVHTMTDTSEQFPAPPIAAQSDEPLAQHKEAQDENGGSNDNTNIINDNNSSPREDAPFDLEADISDDESDEVSLLVVDDEELASAMQEAGISIQVRSASRAASLGS